MADCIFLLRRDLGICLSELRQIKQRIVPEAVISPPRSKYLSRTLPADGEVKAVIRRADKSDDRDELCPALFFRNPVQLFKELSVVVVVVARLSRISCRINPRLSVKIINLKP